LAGPGKLGEHIVPEVTAAAERAGRPAPRIIAFVSGMVTDDVDAAREAAADLAGAE
jgi:alkanesulfonate monooxygenase SsuD/methylene tetrahydromethanopterin reductase-like flavin-dependent oxidoreductase (luciferase family)